MDSSKTRIRLAALLFLIIAGVLLLRLFTVQVINGKKYQAFAEQQYSADRGIAFDRGTIFFQKKEGDLLSAATLTSGYTLYIIPSLISNPDAIFLALSKIIALDQNDFSKKVAKSDDPYEELLQKVSKEKGDEIKKLNLKGVGLLEDRWRFYPAGDLAAHVLGFVGFKGDDFSGRYGIERYYDDVLSRNTKDLYNNFFAQIFLGISNLLAKESSREGDLVLSIEPSVQQFAEERLFEVARQEQIDGGGILVIRPRNGEIVAMAGYPNFNPQEYSKGNIASFSNPFVENVYEFGSIVKPLTLAAGLDAGVITETDTYIDKGFLLLDGRRIENFDGKARGKVPMQEILNQSLNTGAVYVMEQLGREKFREYMKGYGLTQKTDIDLPDEVEPIVENFESPRMVEYATASFGQGIAVTPIAMARALSSLANGGFIVRPHLVKTFDYTGLPSREVKTEEQGKVLTKETTERISAMLTKVVDEALLGGTVKFPHHSIAAKTGTAQMTNPAGGYYTDRYFHSFFGYFPSFDPEFLVLSYIVNPKKGRYASETLTTSFIDTANYLINHYEIPPDR